MNIHVAKIHKGCRILKDIFQYIIFTLFTNLVILFKPEKIKEINISGDAMKGMGDMSFIGELEFEKREDYFSIINNFRICLDTDIMFGYLADSSIESIDDSNFVNLASNNRFIVNCNGVKVGFAVFTLRRAEEELSAFQAIKAKQALKRAGAKVTVLCMKNQDLLFAKMITILKKNARRGFDAAFGFNRKQKGRKNMRTIGFGSTHIFYSLNRYSNKDFVSYNQKSGAVINLGVKNTSKGKALIHKEGYTPIVMSMDNGDYSVQKLKHTDIEKNSVEEKMLSGVERLMQPMHKWDEMIYLKDIFEVLDIPKPEKYTDWMDFSVNEICARTYELAPMNIFFFRQDFRDKNDGKPKSEFWRLRLVTRAILRKSLFIFSYRNLGPFIKHVQVEDAIEAHIKVMAWYRNKISADFIGITGSVGKTSTKDMLYCVMRQAYKTGKSERNTNVQVKIGINMQRISSDTEVFIQEIGGGRPGGASRHSRMILPQATVVTNIGTAHLGNYESQEDLMRNKLQIADGMREGGMLFLNKDDKLLANAGLENNVTYFAVHNKDADYYAENITELDGVTEFDIVSKEGRTHAVLNVLGEYNVLNAICSFAIAKYYHMSDEDIVKGISEFSTSGIRQNLIEIGGCRLFVDCYNASLDSVRNSLTVVEKMSVDREGHRYAVLGDITGMGEYANKINDEVANIIAGHENIDKVVCFGNNAVEIREKAAEFGVDVIAIQDDKELENWLEENVTQSDITLFKGSSKMKLDERIDYVFGSNLADQRYIDEAHFVTSRKKGFRYRVFENYVTVAKCTIGKEECEVRSQLFGKPVIKIARRAFAKMREIKRLKLNSNIIHLGTEAFDNCFGLTELLECENVKYIGFAAFRNCINLKNISLPKVKHVTNCAFKNCLKLESVKMPELHKVAEGQFFRCESLSQVELGEKLTSIERWSFAKCKSLKEIVIPASVEYIDEYAFAYCDSLERIILTNKDTKIHKKAFIRTSGVEVIYE